jgi:hypothetical protein
VSWFFDFEAWGFELEKSGLGMIDRGVRLWLCEYDVNVKCGYLPTQDGLYDRVPPYAPADR